MDTLAFLAVPSDSPAPSPTHTDFLSPSSYSSRASYNSLASSIDENEVPVFAAASSSIAETTQSLAASTFHTAVYALNPQHWSFQQRFLISLTCAVPSAAIAIVSPPGAVAVKIGAFALTSFASLPTLASVYSYIRPRSQIAQEAFSATVSQTHSTNPPQKRCSYAENPFDYLQTQLRWFSDHKYFEEVQNMRPEHPLNWSIANSSTASPIEHGQYASEFLLYDMTIREFKDSYTSKMQAFQIIYRKWYEDVKMKIQSHATQHKWETPLECEEAQSIARESQTTLQEHTVVLEKEMEILLQLFYQKLIAIYNVRIDHVPHPYLSKKIDHTLHQAAFNHFHMRENFQHSTAQVKSNILKEWRNYAPSENTLCGMHYL